jgi:hypothetical protein
MSIAIISRFINIDLPYMSIWFEYYDNLGIDHYYLYYIDNTFFNIEELLNYFPKNKVTIKRIKENNNPNNVFYDDPFTIKEEYILHIDSDEYLYLNNKNIKTFLEDYKNIDAFYFYWYMCPSNNMIIHNFNEILENKNSKKYFIKNYKILFKNKDFTYIKGNSHDVTFLNNLKIIKKNMENPYFLIHFSYRGIYDCYYKYTYQKLLNHTDKDSKINIINQNIKNCYLSQLPSRILVYLGEINNKNEDIQLNIQLNIKEKSQLNLYDLIDNLYKINKRDKELFINRIQYLLSLEIYKNIIIINPNIKNHIKNISQNMYIQIKFP